MKLPKASQETTDKYYKALPVIKIEDTVELFTVDYGQAKTDDERLAAVDKLLEDANIFRLGLWWAMKKKD